MAKRFTNLRRTVCLLLFIYLIPGFSSAQTNQKSFEQQRQEQLNKLDLKGLRKNLLLNNGVISEFEVNYFKNLSNSKRIVKTEQVTSEEWQNLYERLIDTDLRSVNNGRIPDIGSFLESAPDKLTKSNVVPIGILDLKGIYLTPEQIKDNEEQKESKQEVDFTKYDRVRILSSSVLQENLYQGDVYFKVSSSSYISNRDKDIQSLEIDFKDGKGFAIYPISEKLIRHKFESMGVINIRIKPDNSVFLFETKVNISHQTHSPEKQDL